MLYWGNGQSLWKPGSTKARLCSGRREVGGEQCKATHTDIDPLRCQKMQRCCGCLFRNSNIRDARPIRRDEISWDDARQCFLAYWLKAHRAKPYIFPFWGPALLSCPAWNKTVAGGTCFLQPQSLVYSNALSLSRWRWVSGGRLFFWDVLENGKFSAGKRGRHWGMEDVGHVEHNPQPCVCITPRGAMVHTPPPPC